MKDNFGFCIPAEVSKSEEGDWVIEGLASTESVDRQGEIVLQSGIDATPIDQGRGWINNNHLPGIENLLGTLDSYRKTPEGLVVKGRLFKNNTKARAVYEVISSLNKSKDRGRVGLSIEGKVLKRNKDNPKIIEKCQIDKVAITINPVNPETWVTLAKSMDVEGADFFKSLAASDIEFNCLPENYEESASENHLPDEKLFSAAEVVELVSKALSLGAGGTEAPAVRTGGDALAQESMDKKPKNTSSDDEEEKKAKPGSKAFFKGKITEIVDKLMVLYPDNSREEVWAVAKERLFKRFPVLQEKTD